MYRIRLHPNIISFQGALLLYVTVPLILALIFLGYLMLATIEKEIEKQMQKDLELVARAIQLPLSYAVEKNRMGSMRQSLESVFAIDTVYSAYVFDANGNEIIRLGHPDNEPRREQIVKIATDKHNKGEYEEVAGRQVFSYFVPLAERGGRINGLLRLTRRESEFIENLQSFRIRGTLMLVGVLLMISGVIIYGHHRAVGKHLRRLSASMSKIAAGERDHRFENDGPKEIIQIGTAFNHMLNSIDEAEQTIAAHRKKQKALEKRLQHTEKLAAIGRLAAGTAHELGTPLSIISGRAQQALRKQQLPQFQRQALTAIRTEVDRMSYIIKQLLDFSGRNPPRRASAYPGQLIASAVASLAEEAQTARTYMRVINAESEIPIWVDAIKIQQALVNLLRNAVQCTHDGTVCLSWRQNDKRTIFCIEDNGPGVPEENRSKIFEPFYTTKDAGKGIGLGLSIVHAVTEEHGGIVSVGQSPMGGASFTLQLPSGSVESLQ